MPLNDWNMPAPYTCTMCKRSNFIPGLCEECAGRPRCRCCGEFCDRLEDGKDAKYCCDCAGDYAINNISED